MARGGKLFDEGKLAWARLCSRKVVASGWTREIGARERWRRTSCFRLHDRVSMVIGLKTP